MITNKQQSAFPSILDFEASGFGSESYPIEVGVVATSGQRYCTLIRPQRDWIHWSNEAARIHQISRNSLVQFGKDVREVCIEMNMLLKDSTVYSDAWTHDNGWLIRLYHAATMAPTFKLSPIEAIATETQLALWDETKLQVQRNLGVLRHRASSDALIIQQTFVESRRLAGRKPPGGVSRAIS
ncbi:hypothetical protein WKI13_04605 [Teredinibacter turnerae]|uniref:hypothetical protein n=1 Tax=Teredinibacter turnerae TaxID=2426 RepID=UPI0003813E74|nr:hypothetical protein [Teredinibacter turnerae]